MKLSFSSKVFYRVPQFAVDALLSVEWEVLKTSIQESSPAFYETVRDVVEAGTISTLPAGVQHTIWKYFNRARYRATPYGSFAGFGLAPFGSGSEGIVVETGQVLNRFADWTLVEGLKKSFEDLLETELWLVANSGYYCVGEGIRYLSSFDGSFELSDLEGDAFRLRVLDGCRKPVLFTDLVARLGIGKGDYALIEEMIALQLLLTSNDPNLIGEEYFKRVGAVGAGDFAAEYLVAERRFLSGAFDLDVFKALPELAFLISEVYALKENENLSRFIQAFSRKFEGKWVPLMRALDPELGVGYCDMEESGAADELAGRFAVRASDSDQVNPLREVLLNALMGSGSKILDLAQLDLPVSSNKGKVPNTFSVICGVSGDLVWLDMMAGSSANALLGRFTLENEAVTAYAREIAALEAEANPGVLFFDVAYMAEGRVDNINRRNRIYDWQLSILNYDTSASPLEMSDLYVCVVAKELVLFSKKLGKRLVPRMASAYNYTRSDVSVFRLLCDLQSQGLQTVFSMSAEALFPGFSFYPRLQYKNIVVAPAKWLVRYADVKAQINHEHNLEGLRLYLLAMGMERVVLVRTADMTLSFDLFEDGDVTALMVLLKKQSKLFLEESYLPEDGSVRDERGRVYKSQLVLALTHRERIYAPVAEDLFKTADLMGLRRNFSPGSEWLYFEIYCHVYRSDALLGELIAPFLSEYSRYIKSWFFIRYRENGDHLRLRILLHDAGSGQLLVSGLSAVLSEHLESGIVSEMLLKTYKREIERYAAGGMENVEGHFGVDSDYVLSLLGLDLGVMDKYKLCVWVAVSVMESRLISPVVFERLVGRICDSFAAEHKVEVSGFKELNNEYKVFKKFVPVALEGVALEHGNMFLSSLLSVLSGCDVGRRGQLFGDLMHMHVNRLFADQQRVHEMIMYYFLQKELLMRKAMAGKQAVEI